MMRRVISLSVLCMVVLAMKVQDVTLGDGPEVPKVKDMSLGKSEDLAGVSLPQYWKMFTNSNPRPEEPLVYFHNSSTDERKWEHPTTGKKSDLCGKFPEWGSHGYFFTKYTGKEKLSEFQTSMYGPHTMQDGEWKYYANKEGYSSLQFKNEWDGSSNKWVIAGVELSGAIVFKMKCDISKDIEEDIENTRFFKSPSLAQWISKADADKDDANAEVIAELYFVPHWTNWVTPMVFIPLFLVAGLAVYFLCFIKDTNEESADEEPAQPANDEGNPAPQPAENAVPKENDVENPNEAPAQE